MRIENECKRQRNSLFFFGTFSDVIYTDQRSLLCHTKSTIKKSIPWTLFQFLSGLQYNFIETIENRWKKKHTQHTHIDGWCFNYTKVVYCILKSTKTNETKIPCCNVSMMLIPHAVDLISFPCWRFINSIELACKPLDETMKKRYIPVQNNSRTHHFENILQTPKRDRERGGEGAILAKMLMCYFAFWWS